MNESELKSFIKTKIEPSNAPGLLRLAFHDAGTFCKSSQTGGVNGSIVNSPEEINRDVNDGLLKSVTLINCIKNEVPQISNSDLIAVAGAVSVEICGGPIIDVGLGRKDVFVADPDNRLPDENDNADQLKSQFERMGLSAKDLVVLSGAHTLGDAKDKPFTDDRLQFNNAYFVNLQKRELPQHLGRFKSDESLNTDAEMKSYVSLYATNQEQFFNDFKESYKKMTSLGR